MDEKETMRQDAIKQGLLSDASRQAELAIKSLLEEMGFKKVDVTTEIIIPELQ